MTRLLRPVYVGELELLERYAQVRVGAAASPAA
jgi:hypothetical protein